MAKRYKVEILPLARVDRWRTQFNHRVTAPIATFGDGTYERPCTCAHCPDCGHLYIATLGSYRPWKAKRCSQCQIKHELNLEAAAARRRRAANRITRTATCQHCSNTFTPQRSTARFCSTACRVAHHRTVNK